MLTNFPDVANDKELKRLIRDQSNADPLDEMAKSQLTPVMENIKAQLHQIDWGSPEMVEVSAEMHAWALLGKQPSDLHFLLHSDTYLGGWVAHVLCDWLERRNLRSQPVLIEFLKTDTPTNFHLGMGWLTQWLEENVNEIRKSNSAEVIFQLSGGFKAWQGFMQGLAAWYADRVVYVFEGTSELLDLPRLPVKWELEEGFLQALTPFRRLMLDLPVEISDLKPLSNLYWTTMDGKPTATPWGQVIWGTFVKSLLYDKKVWPAPSPRICLTSGFFGSVEHLESDRFQRINSQLDKLAIRLERGTPLDGAEIKKLSGEPKEAAGSTHEMYAWNDKDAARFYGHFEGEVFCVDRLGRHLR